VSVTVLLDAGPLGLVTNPNASPEYFACSSWLESLLVRGVRAGVPEIPDYEVRRELLRARKSRGLERLDLLEGRLHYFPITTAVMLQAAEFWARARQQGRPTAANAALDGDVILAAQAVVLSRNGDTAIVATTNVGHLGRFVDARRWQDIV
jgi:predicted nucleic acid-binding protein